LFPLFFLKNGPPSLTFLLSRYTISPPTPQQRHAGLFLFLLKANSSVFFDSPFFLSVYPSLRILSFLPFFTRVASYGITSSPRRNSPPFNVFYFFGKHLFCLFSFFFSSRDTHFLFPFFMVEQALRPPPPPKTNAPHLPHNLWSEYLAVFISFSLLLREIFTFQIFFLPFPSSEWLGVFLFFFSGRRGRPSKESTFLDHSLPLSFYIRFMRLTPSLSTLEWFPLVRKRHT